MSGPRFWMGEPEAPTTLTQARARIPRGQVPFSICTCWMDSCGPAAWAASGRSTAASAHHDAFGCLITMFLLLPLLAERAALELELDVSQLDDVVVDGGVLARHLLVGEHHVAVGRGAEHVLPHAEPEVLALVLAVERHQPAAHLALLRVLGALAQVRQVHHRGALPGRRHRHGHAAAPAATLHGHHLLHLQ